MGKNEVKNGCENGCENDGEKRGEKQVICLGSGTVYPYTLLGPFLPTAFFTFGKAVFTLGFPAHKRGLWTPSQHMPPSGGRRSPAAPFFTLGASGGRSLQLGRGWPNWGSELVRAGCMMGSRQPKKRELHDCLDHSMGHADGRTGGGTWNNVFVTTVLSFP